MSGSVSFGGLISGLDSKQIASQLVTVRKNQVIAPLNTSISKIQAQQAGIEQIKSTFSLLMADAKELKDPDNEAYTAKKGTSSDTAIVAVTSVVSSKAVNGTYNLTNISTLAKPDRILFNGVANKTVTQFGTGTISITYKSGTTQIAITSSNNTLEGIMGAINSANAGVTASIINDGAASPYRLILTSNDTGSDTTITHNIDSVLTLVVDAAASSDSANEPANASFKVNSVTMTSKSNKVTDAIPGVTFDLLKTETTNTITLTVEADVAKIAGNIKSFVNNYNTLRSALVAATQPDAKTKKLGVLGHDLTLSNSFIQMAQIVGKQFVSLAGYAYTNLVGIGITLEDNGVLKVDDAKLNTAIKENPTSVRLLFQGSSSEDGIAEETYDYIDTLTKPEGVFAERKEGEDNEIKRLEDLVKERTKRLLEYEAKIQKRFNNLESVSSGLKNQEAQITSFAGVFAKTNSLLL